MARRTKAAEQAEPELQLPQISACTFHLLHRATQAADALFASQQMPHGLTPRKYAVLKAVSEADAPPSQTDLVAATGVDRSTLADIVRRLDEGGLLRRVRTAQDARAYSVSLTERGMAVLEACARPAARVDRELLSGLTQEHREAFLAALQRLADDPVAEHRVGVDTEAGRAA
jgi:MarR family transcriptional regulator, temperature-dependent positive regulator of motility